MGSARVGVSLVVLCKRATKLKNADWVGKSDPYVVLHILNDSGETIAGPKKTRTIDSNLNPQWDEVIIMDIPSAFDPMTCKLKMQVFDEDGFFRLGFLTGDDELGEATVPLSMCGKNREFQDMELIIDPKLNSKLYV